MHLINYGHLNVECNPDTLRFYGTRNLYIHIHVPPPLVLFLIKHITNLAKKIKLSKRSESWRCFKSKAFLKPHFSDMLKFFMLETGS